VVVYSIFSGPELKIKAHRIKKRLEVKLSSTGTKYTGKSVVGKKIESGAKSIG
jgi:hypothetical protein